MKKVFIAIAFLFVAQSAGMIGAFFTVNAIDTWYVLLAKPVFSPPNWLFGPVWTTLYVMMGIAGFLVYEKGWKHDAVRTALFLFASQLILNTLWSILFFGFRSPESALVEIIFLWFFIFFTMKAFYTVSKLAAYLLVPYLAWVSFAIMLNGAIVYLNS